MCWNQDFLFNFIYNCKSPLNYMEITHKNSKIIEDTKDLSPLNYKEITNKNIKTTNKTRNSGRNSFYKWVRIYILHIMLIRINLADIFRKQNLIINFTIIHKANDFRKLLRQHYWLEKFPCLVWRHSIRTNSHKSTQTWTGIITSSLKPEQVLLHQASNLNRYYYIKPQTWTGIITSSIKPEQVLLHQASNLNRYYYIKDQGCILTR